MINLIYGSFDEIDILTPSKHYETLCLIGSDINEHLPTLKEYSEQCNTITEMGVRYACSTWAFIEAKPKKLICIDISYSSFEPSEKYIKKMCIDYDIDFSFITGDTLKIDIENTDLLFIDTLHRYGQLVVELNKHSKNVNKWIILHDTSTFGSRDEDLYPHSSDIIENLNKVGLVSAIDDFLEINKNWKIKEVFTNNNGLTILERII